MRYKISFYLLLPSLVIPIYLSANEHGGSKLEHGGHSIGAKEHGGHSIGKNQNKVTAEMLKKVLNEYIKKKSLKGIFTHVDADRNKTKLSLKFIKIHDPVRYMPKKASYFACTDFHAKGNDKKIYDLDFWLKKDKKNNLAVIDVKVHKDPVYVGWFKNPRYTFEGEEISEIR